MTAKLNFHRRITTGSGVYAVQPTDETPDSAWALASLINSRSTCRHASQISVTFPITDSRIVTFGGNFGQAAAIDLFGKKYGLPKSIASHHSYYFWGPRGYSGESIIFMGARMDQLTPYFSSIQPVGEVYHPYAMPYEQFTVYYCRGIKMPLKDLWPKIKNWN